MIERQLTRLITKAVRRSRGDGSWLWIAIGVIAWLLRRMWRETDTPERVKVSRGHSVTISVHDPVD